MSSEPKPPVNTVQPMWRVALADDLAWRTPQIEALHQSIAAADRGEFASADEVEQFFNNRTSE
jgi:predicted transcriptional regulator